MTDAIDLWEEPKSEEMYMIAGWRQWADAGSISSRLPRYLIQQSGARQIGTIRPDGFYLFQIPGTHDLVRPDIQFEEGFPTELDVPENQLFYAGDKRRGLLYFVGDEPHLDIERYVATLLQVAKRFGVKRIVAFGGVYGELPYDKERMVSCVYSQRVLKAELDNLAVNLSNYRGGASIGSYLCKRAGEQDVEFIGFYAFVPTYDFSEMAEISNSIRIENDFMAWLGVMRRVNYMLGLDIDLTELEEKSANLRRVVGEKVEELDRESPQLGVRAYLDRLAEEFTETHFDPLDVGWEEEVRRLLDDFDPGEL